MPPGAPYAGRAWIVSLAGFAVSFATSRSLQRAIAALYGSLPRPARIGRDVFSSEIGRILELNRLRSPVPSSRPSAHPKHGCYHRRRKGEE